MRAISSSSSAAKCACALLNPVTVSMAIFSRFFMANMIAVLVGQRLSV